MWLFYYYLWLATLCVRCLVYIDCVDVTIKRPCCWLLCSVRTFINWIGLCTNPHHDYCLFLSTLYNHANGRSGLIWNPIVWFLLILHSRQHRVGGRLAPSLPPCRLNEYGEDDRLREKREGGVDETAAKWLWHARPSLLSRGRAFRVGCWCKKVSVRHFTRRSASIDHRGEEKSERNRSRSPSLCERLVVGKEDRDWEQYASFEKVHGNRMFRSLFVSFSRCVSLFRSFWDAKSCPFTMMVYVCAQK